MLALLHELEAEPGPAKSLYLPPALDAGEKEKLLWQVVEPDALLSDVVDLASDSTTGVVLFWGVARKLLVLPPFPIREKYLAFGYDVEPVCSMLQSELRVALILVRMGAFAIGVCRGEELVLSKVGSGLVHARHKKGGSSQKRFQRRQDNEVDAFIKRVCGHVRERLEPRVKEIDYVVYGGGREAILLLRKECRFLHQFDGCLLPPLLDIPSPRKTVLEAAVSRVWSSHLIEWREK
jgi:hypothetical protein